MTLSYRLPKQTPCAMPLDAACTVEAAKVFIKSEHQIALPFKLRIFIRGQQVFLKASQTLEEVVAMGAEVISVMYHDQAAMQSARRKLAKETAALVGTHVHTDGDKTRNRIRDSAEDIKAHIKTELMTLSSGARRSTGLKSKLAGKTVLAASPDHEMGDSTYEICHVESQTWADGNKHTVCLIKCEGKPSLSREFSSLTIHDPFISRDATQSVRVVVLSKPNDHVQPLGYHVGWRGTVAKVSPSGRVQLNFPYLSDGRVAHKSAAIPREHLQILAEDDVSMMPNQHPWVGKQVTVQEGSGEIVHVTDKGKAKIKIAKDGSKKKKIIFVESSGASFESLFDSSASPIDGPSQAAPKLPAAQEPAEQHGEPRGAIAVADSDGESDGPALPRPHGSDEEPLVPEPKKKATPQKRPAGALPLQPKKRGRRKAASSSGRDVD
jgi:hypothetical protein